MLDFELDIQTTEAHGAMLCMCIEALNEISKSPKRPEKIAENCLIEITAQIKILAAIRSTANDNSDIQPSA